MNTARIFAAVDANGHTRFVGDVPGGIHCGCFCAACGSPLIARHGAINVWHFAHEAQQERVECLVGAMNLLRRLAAEQLRSLPKLVLPKYRREVVKLLPTRRAVEPVEWDAQPVSIVWLDQDTQGAPIGRLVLDTEATVEIFVEISDTAPMQRYPSSSQVGSIVFWSTIPVDSDLRKEVYARQHVSRYGQLVWLHQPDTYGLVADAQQRLNKAAEAEERAIAEQVKRDRERFERVRAEFSAPRPPPPEPVASANLPNWVRHKKQNRPYFGYRLKGHGAWVLFELVDGRCGIRRLDAGERWFDDSLCAGAVYDPAMELLIVNTFVEGQSLLRKPVEATQISSNFADMLQLWP